MTRVCPWCRRDSTPESTILADLTGITHEHFIARCCCPACGAQWDEYAPFRWGARTVNRLVKAGRLVGELMPDDDDDYGRPEWEPDSNKEAD